MAYGRFLATPFRGLRGALCILVSYRTVIAHTVLTRGSHIPHVRAICDQSLLDISFGVVAKT